MAPNWIVLTRMRLGWIFQSNMFEVIGLPQSLVTRKPTECIQLKTIMATSEKTYSYVLVWDKFLTNTKVCKVE